MIHVTKLYCGADAMGDTLRYGQSTEIGASQRSINSWGRKPVVVWNCTRRCNLSCAHCYADSADREYPGELSYSEGRALLDDLAEFGSPVILFSGGEPLLRPDLLSLAAYARGKGVRPVISTNGTLITREVAHRIKEAGVAYVGVSLDGIEGRNDRFRGHQGAYRAALEGIAHCVAVGQRVGLRFTLSRRNYVDLEAIFDLIEAERIDRACFYHLVYSGRGKAMQDDSLSHGQTRAALDLIIDRAAHFHRRGLDKEILTVDNHADGVYLYLRMKREGSERAEKVLQLLRRNGGNSSGLGIGCVDNQGNVHADQFWWHHTLGNVRQRRFSDIWQDSSDPIQVGLRDRKLLLKGRCAACRHLDICNGNFRVRAEAVHGDPWAPDPACYLADEEIGMV